MRITEFGGIIPRMAPRLLPGQSAQAAANCSLLPGELRPMRKSRKVYSPALATAVRSIFRVDDTTWFVWPTEGVQAVRAPLEGEARFLYTGDGIPKITTKTLGTPVSASGTPAAARTLGIPKPLTAPGLAHTGGSGAVVSRFYVYTFVSDWNEEGPESPVSGFITGKVDGTWQITGMDLTPANGGNVTAAVHAAGKVTLTLSAKHYLRAGDPFTVAGVLGMTDLNGVWTVESVPANNQVRIVLATAQTYTSGGAWARVYPWGPCTKRIYRSSGTGGQFQLVAEGVAGATYDDTLLDVAIPGDDLISQAWEPPPTNLTGLVELSNGSMAGFMDGGRTVCLCEPFQPHAWPESYQRKVNSDIVGIAAFDTNVGVATKGVPVVLAGSEPGVMIPTRMAKPFPCLSRASVASTGDGMVFATKNGLARVDLVQATLFSEALFTPEGWNALGPASMRCAFDGVRLYVYTQAAGRIYILNLASGGAMVNAYQQLDCATADGLTGDFYFAFSRSVYRFDSFDTAPMTMDWWSKEFLLAKPANLGAAKVEFDEAFTTAALAALQQDRAEQIAANGALMAGVQGARGSRNTRPWNAAPINGSTLVAPTEVAITIAFRLYADGKLVYQAEVPDQRAFPLPNKYRTDNFSVRIQSNTQVKSITLAETMKGLANA